MCWNEILKRVRRNEIPMGGPWSALSIIYTLAPSNWEKYLLVNHIVYDTFCNGNSGFRTINGSFYMYRVYRSRCLMLQLNIKQSNDLNGIKNTITNFPKNLLDALKVWEDPQRDQTFCFRWSEISKYLYAYL